VSTVRHAASYLAQYNDESTTLLPSTPFGTMMVSTVRDVALTKHPIHSQSPVGLIRWKVVIHAFVDGKTRFVVGIRAHDNNRARTVLDFFMEIIKVHGTPSRVRGDHGVENVRVADYMEWKMGRNRGSYIWGRCIALVTNSSGLLTLRQECAQHPD
jgi:hypothetical protein